MNNKKNWMETIKEWTGEIIISCLAYWPVILAVLLLIAVVVGLAWHNDKDNDKPAESFGEIIVVEEKTVEAKESKPETKQEEPVVEEQSAEVIHTVVKGDTLWDMAEKYYNKGEDYLYIAAKNNIRTPLEIGQKLIIPSEEEKQSLDIKSFIPAPAPKPVAIKTSTSQPAQNNQTQSTSSAKNNIQVDGKELEFYANCKITGYGMFCGHCNGRTDGKTASGVIGKVGTTVAMTGLPFGTQVYIEGYGYYVVQDRGAFGKAHVDIACSTHEECNRMTGRANVYIVK